MTNILIIDTTWPINNRTEKFRKTLSKDFKVFVSAWDRANSKEPTTEKDHFILFNRIGYGNQLKKLICLPKFLWHNILVFRKVNPNFIFASHWDSLICATITKIITNSDVKIIYDCLDLPTSKNPIILRLLKVAENFCLKFTSLTIFASRYYPQLYPNLTKYKVFENYPSKSLLQKNTPPEWYSDVSNNNSSDIPIISWIGVVRYPEIIINILNSIRDLETKVFIFGDGPSLDIIKHYVQSNSMQNKVTFFGRFNQKDLVYIYEISDYVWAAYPTLDLNAIYAISNKYFESSLFRKVPIFSKNTKMAENLSSQGSDAILVDEYNIDNIKLELMKAFRKSLHKLIFEQYEPTSFWEDHEESLLKYLKSL